MFKVDAWNEGTDEVMQRIFRVHTESMMVNQGSIPSFSDWWASVQKERAWRTKRRAREESFDAPETPRRANQAPLPPRPIPPYREGYLDPPDPNDSDARNDEQNSWFWDEWDAEVQYEQERKRCIQEAVDDNHFPIRLYVRDRFVVCSYTTGASMSTALRLFLLHDKNKDLSTSELRAALLRGELPSLAWGLVMQQKDAFPWHVDLFGRVTQLVPTVDARTQGWGSSTTQFLPIGYEIRFPSSSHPAFSLFFEWLTTQDDADMLRTSAVATDLLRRFLQRDTIASIVDTPEMMARWETFFLSGLEAQRFHDMTLHALVQTHLSDPVVESEIAAATPADITEISSFSFDLFPSEPVLLATLPERVVLPILAATTDTSSREAFVEKLFRAGGPFYSQGRLLPPMVESLYMFLIGSLTYRKGAVFFEEEEWRPLCLFSCFSDVIASGKYRSPWDIALIQECMQ